MPGKRKRSGKPEMLSRDVEISSFRASTWIRAVQHKNDEPDIETQPWLELHGTALEAIQGVTDVEISMYPREPLVVGTARPAACGAIIQSRPKLGVVITWSHADFDRVWALAMGGHLRFAHLHFTKPHYNRGLVVSASFSSEREE